MTLEARFAVDADRSSEAADLDLLDGADLPIDLYVDDREMEAATVTVESLLGDHRRFCDEAWDRRPMQRRGAGKALCDELPTSLLWSHLCRLPEARLRVTHSERPVPSPAYRATRYAFGGAQSQALPGALQDLVERGASLIGYNMQRDVPQLYELMRSLMMVLDCNVDMCLYVSPPGAGALGLHHDVGGSLLVQLSGTKVFDVFAPVRQSPMLGEWWTTEEPASELVDSVELTPGDVLYMPSGFPHRARAGEAGSWHLSISMHTRRHVEWLQDVVGSWRSEAEGRRSSIAYDDDSGPPTEAFPLSGEWERLVQLDAALQRLERVRRMNGFGFDHARFPLERSTDQEDFSALRRRAVAAAVVTRRDRLVVVLPDRELTFAVSARNLLQRVLSSPSENALPMAALAGDGLGETEVREVCAFLVRQGVVDPVRSESCR